MADLLHVDRGTLTGILERLVGKGLVSRRGDPADGRRSMLTLSARGRRLNAATSGTIEAKVQRALATASSADVAAAKRVLETIAAQLVLDKTRAATRRSAPRSAPRSKRTANAPTMRRVDAT